MRRTARRTAAGLLAASLALASGGHAAVTCGRALEVVADRGVVWRAPIRLGERFDLSFLHSSERCLWTQHYRATVGGIWQESSTFPCFGAGMPSGSSDATPVLRTRSGYVVSAPRLIGEVPMLSWQRGDITLELRGRSVALSPVLDDFERFTVRIR